jgi:signal transduction histidine kinase
LSRQNPPSPSSPRPGWLAASAIYLFYAAVVLRTLALQVVRPRLPIYLALEGLYLVLFSVMLWRPGGQPALRQGYFLLQALVVLGLHALRLRFDFIIVLYIPLCYQAALLLRSPARWLWVGCYLLLSSVPLVFELGALQGLALALLPMTACLIFPAYVAVNQELEAASRASQSVLAELQAANQQLQAYAGQVEQLSAIQERNRLARELHDSVSQTMFSITLHTHAARILLEHNPDRLRSELEQLRTLAQSALNEMRGLIAQLRPKENEPAGQPAPSDLGLKT